MGTFAADKETGLHLDETSQDSAYEPVETLARSLFGFALFAWIPMLMTWCLFVLSPIPPDENYARIRVIIIMGFGMLTLLDFGLTVWIFRQGHAVLLRMAGYLARVLGNRWLALILMLACVEANFLAFALLENIAPFITNPLKFLLFCWTLVFGGVLLTLHWLHLKNSWHGTGYVWAGIGIAAVSAFVLLILFSFSHLLANVSGISGRLRGSLDYRRLEFIDDGESPAPQQFWAEQGQTIVRWLPYSYWTVALFDGEFINVDRQGLRYTPLYADEAAASIYFFGGSTLWGEGARDAYTIPGQAAKLLSDAGHPAIVLNYGQTGYVSTQDLILFQAQLTLGRAPDIAVFYQGFNDVFSAYTQDRSGIPYEEHQRVSDVEAGRLLRRGQPVLRLPEGDISRHDWSLISSADADADAIADRWFANRRLVQTLADGYGVRVLFVWQPALFAKQTLVGAEARLLEDPETSPPEFVALYREVDRIVRQRVAADATDNVMVLTDLFRDSEQELFYDRVHITEIGNLMVAEAIQSRLFDLLTD